MAEILLGRGGRGKRRKNKGQPPGLQQREEEDPEPQLYRSC
jgi:hypothetical protein